jgi:hypothetical protein
MAEPEQPASRKPVAKPRPGPIVVRPPRTAPLSDEQRQQAVTALAALITEWWNEHQAS